MIKILDPGHLKSKYLNTWEHLKVRNKTLHQQKGDVKR